MISNVFKVMGNSFQTLGIATEKACLPKLSLVLRTIHCCKMDDLSCIRIFERSRTLSKYSGSKLWSHFFCGSYSHFVLNMEADCSGRLMYNLCVLL